MVVCCFLFLHFLYKQIDEFVRMKSASAYHPSCTCAMGTSKDSDAVVDPETMCVHGLENLRVSFAKNLLKSCIVVLGMCVY